MHTFPDPNFSIVSTHPAADPGTVTLWACLAGTGLSTEKPSEERTSKDKSWGQRPLLMCVKACSDRDIKYAHGRLENYQHTFH